VKTSDQRFDWHPYEILIGPMAVIEGEAMGHWSGPWPKDVAKACRVLPVSGFTLAPSRCP